jgi:hypothetical protein
MFVESLDFAFIAQTGTSNVDTPSASIAIGVPVEEIGALLAVDAIRGLFSTLFNGRREQSPGRLPVAKVDTAWPQPGVKVSGRDSRARWSAHSKRDVVR